MQPPAAAVRIVFASPPDAEPADILAALARLGEGVALEGVRDAERCIARCRAGDVDLVVCARDLPGCERLLEALRPTGPPVVVTARGAGEEAALEAFRRGAADFVDADADAGFAEALPVAALEQVRSWRAARGLEQLQRQVLQSEKLASIGQLAAGVAHEINNPVGFVHANLVQMAEYADDLRRLWERVRELQKAAERGEPGEIQRAARELAAAGDEAEVEYLLSDLATAIRESREGAERIKHIVQDLREFSHHGADERAHADVNQCLDSTASIVWPMMKHLVRLEKDYAELPPLECSPMRLKQIFINLLVNAYHAIESRVGESGEMGDIELRTRVRDGAIVVRVADSGCGIAPEHLSRIFDPFFTTKKVGSGTGLGLSTSLGIAQAHGGTLTVESRLGEGTTFELVLPLAPRGAA